MGTSPQMLGSLATIPVHTLYKITLYLKSTIAEHKHPMAVTLLHTGQEAAV